jgi:hypothetical protein
MIRPTKNLTHDSVNEKLTNENITYLPMESDNFEYLYQGYQLLLTRKTAKKRNQWKMEKRRGTCTPILIPAK